MTRVFKNPELRGDDGFPNNPVRTYGYSTDITIGQATDSKTISVNLPEDNFSVLKIFMTYRPTNASTSLQVSYGSSLITDSILPYASTLQSSEYFLSLKGLGQEDISIETTNCDVLNFVWIVL